MPQNYDVIVIGTGGVGCAALYQLASRGVNVLGIDRFPPGHDRGSSHGHTRIIRQAYFEHDNYVPLVLRAYPQWHELSDLVGEQLIRQNGIIEIGAADGTIIPPILASAKQHNLKVDHVDRKDFLNRYSDFVLPDGCEIVFEGSAGILFVERCVRAMAAIATSRGAEIVSDESVRDWKPDNNGVLVTTEKKQYQAKTLILSAGAWLQSSLSDLQLPLTVVRKHLHWYASDAYHIDDGTPTFFYETAEGYFYGFPALDSRGIKVGEHSGGVHVQDPLEDDRSVDPLDRQRVEAFLTEHIPRCSLTATDHAVCYYTRTPDEHFIVDRHPMHSQVLICGGLSGHGFKFTPSLGEALADLATTDHTDLPIEFLRLSRFE